MENVEKAISRIMADKVYTSAEFKRERDNFHVSFAFAEFLQIFCTTILRLLVSTRRYKYRYLKILYLYRYLDTFLGQVSVSVSRYFFSKYLNFFSDTDTDTFLGPKSPTFWVKRHKKLQQILFALSLSEVYWLPQQIPDLGDFTNFFDSLPNS